MEEASLGVAVVFGLLMGIGLVRRHPDRWPLVTANMAGLITGLGLVMASGGDPSGAWLLVGCSLALVVVVAGRPGIEE